MLDRPNGDNTTLYPPVEQMFGFGEWVDTIDIRIKRLQQFVFPRLERAKQEARGSETAQFLRTAMQELSGICLTQFTGCGRFPSEIPIYCLLDENSDQTLSYNLNGNRGTHDESTIHAAQEVIDAICPELGVKITDSRSSLMRKVDQAKILGYARFSPSGDAYYAAMCGTASTEFSTILPGVGLSLTCRKEGQKYISLDWQVM